MTTTLVLGGGGVGGWIFHAGVIDGLEQAGSDRRSVHTIVGTSAGAAVGAAFRGGAEPEEIRDLIDRPPTAGERSQMAEWMRANPARRRPMDLRLAWRSIWRADAGLVVAGLLPPGRFPTHPFARVAEGLAPSGWPDGLWICATRVDDGTIEVFGRDRSDVAVGDAVEASLALPGVMAPKSIGRDRYVDGGVVSPTSADQVPEGTDLVLVSSPMSARSGPVGRFARRRLRSEIRRLHRAGAATRIIEPTREDADLMAGYPRRNRASGAEILESGRRAVLRALEGT